MARPPQPGSLVSCHTLHPDSALLTAEQPLVNPATPSCSVVNLLQAHTGNQCTCRIKQIEEDPDAYADQGPSAYLYLTTSSKELANEARWEEEYCLHETSGYYHVLSEDQRRRQEVGLHNLWGTTMQMARQCAWSGEVLKQVMGSYEFGWHHRHSGGVPVLGELQGPGGGGGGRSGAGLAQSQGGEKGGPQEPGGGLA